MSYHNGKLTKNLVRTLGAGRHGDGNGLYLVVDPSGARRWIVRVTVKGHAQRRFDDGIADEDQAECLLVSYDWIAAYSAADRMCD